MGVHMGVNVEDLEDWAIRASQAMQDIIDEAERAEGGDGTSNTACCQDLKLLLVELDQIVAGVPAWQRLILSNTENTEPLKKLAID